MIQTVKMKIMFFNLFVKNVSWSLGSCSLLQKELIHVEGPLSDHSILYERSQPVFCCSTAYSEARKRRSALQKAHVQDLASDISEGPWRSPVVNC